MKSKKIVAGILAAAITVSSIAPEAFAQINDSDCYMVDVADLIDDSIDISDVYGAVVKFTDESAEVLSKGANGGFVFSTESYNWDQLSWCNGCDEDEGHDIIWDSETNSLTRLDALPICTKEDLTDGYAQIALTQWFGDNISVKSIALLDKYGNELTAKDMPENPVPGDSSGEVPEPGEDESDYTYSVLDDGTIEITNYKGSEGNIDIPAEIDEKRVTSIGERAFSSCTSLTSVTIPNSVTNIGDYAFCFCTDLASITIPDSVTSIGRNAFSTCNSLTSIIIPDSVTSINDDTFEGCYSLTSVTLPDGVTTIGKWAFFNCDSLTGIIIPNSVTSIDRFAFCGCDSLTSIVIPDGVTSIGENAFSECENLTDVTIPASLSCIDDNTFYYCTSLTNVTISDGVTSIGSCAFEGCTSLISITIPNSVTGIHEGAFSNCISLTEIKVDAENAGYISVNGVLFNKDMTSLKCYPAGKKDNNYNIPDSVVHIDYEAFMGCTSLTTITIPDSVENIYYRAFSDCKSLEKVVFPASMISIASEAFYNCTSLKSVTISTSVTNIGDKAFYNCTSLKSVTIPASVTSIDNEAFGYYYDKDSENTKNVDGFKINYVKNTRGHWYATKNGFSDEACLITCELDDGTLEIVGYSGNSATYEIPAEIDGKKVTKIGDDAFKDCAELTSVTISDGITIISNSAFWCCTSLELVTIPASMTEIGNQAFLGCEVLETIIIPAGVIKIGSEAFLGCEAIEAITIPAGVTEIGSFAFGYYRRHDSSKIRKIDGFKIYCYSGTAGEQYAKDEGFDYEILDCETHEFDDWVIKIAATCTTDGFRTRTCPACGRTETEHIFANGHEFVNGICKNCNKTEAETIHSNHPYYDYWDETWTIYRDSAKWIAVTFTEDTYTESKSDFIYIYDGNDKLIGSYSGDELSGKTITVNSDTVKIRLVSDSSGTAYGFALNKIEYGTEALCDHSNTEIRNAVSAGCTTEGYTGDTYCTDCDELISSGEVIPAKGHTEVIDEAVEATCTKTGLTEGKHCSVCNTVLKAQEVVPAKGHQEVIDKAVAATCTKTGLTEGKHCSVCNIVLKARETIPATGKHEFGDWTITKAATCTTAGTQTRTCSGCAKVETQAIPALGHDYSTDWTTDKSATCGAVGSKSHHCTRCGAKKDVTAILATGKHDFNNWKTTKAATYTATGTKTRTCKVCKKTETATIAKLTLAKIGGFKVKAKDSTSITLQWSRNANASGYIIEAYNGKTWVQVTKIAKNSTLTYKVTKLSASKTYRYRIKAYKTEGKATAYSAYSATLSVNTNPSNMSGFKAKAKSYNSITLQWNKNTSATGYELQKWDGKKWVSLTKISKNSTTTYTVKSLKASTTYKYRIRAYKTIGKATQYSAYTATLSVNTNPYNMSGFKAKSKTATSITLQWNKNASATGYELQKWNGKKWVSLTKINKNSTTTYTVKSLKASTTYKYRIRAYKTIGKATQYSAYTATLSVNTNPSNMSGFKAKSKSYNSVTLQWNKNTSATGYELQKWNGKKWVALTKISKNSTTTYTVKSLKASTTYKYRIRAYKTIGKTTQYSAYTATLSVNTNPTNMGGFKAKSKSYNSITLQWNKNTSATGYELQKWDGKKWVTLTKISKNSTTTYTVKSLKASTTYKYRIRAYKTIGKATQYSAYTTTLSVNTNPSNMSGFKAKSTAKTSVTLQWNKNTSATGYEIQKWNGKKWVSAAKVTKNSTVTSTVKSLKKNTSYKFRIRAYKTIGKATQYSSWSGTLTVKTK